jgi:hypothetical protein
MGRARRNAEAELDGALQKLRAVQVLHIGQHLGYGDGGELAALRARDAGQALQRAPHSAGFVEDGLDAFALLRVERRGPLFSSDA